MFLILLKTLISLAIFAGVYVIVTTVADEIERKKELEAQEKETGVIKKKGMDFDNIFAVFETSPNSKKARLIKFASAGGFFVFFLALSGKLLISCALGAGGFLIPKFISDLRKEKKAQRIDSQLADGLVLIANSLKAGMSFPQTIEVMSRQGSPPLSDEFAVVGREVKIGVSMEKALFNFVGRWPKIVNLRIAVIAINIAQEVGGNLSETLSRLSDTMRKRKEIQGKIDSLTTQGKLSGVITALMPFALFAAISWMSPDIMAPMINTALGNLMLIVILVLIAAGFMIIQKIVDIDI
ncbi:type II secretion system F family protein [bacterium]|nr:hypothetical protein [bacterium]MBU3955512.1 type II secretion system F family protein [bacterium]MBU4134460.1 type II secretion system F family protein [bacterium]